MSESVPSSNTTEETTAETIAETTATPSTNSAAVAIPATTGTMAPATLYCANHPDTETLLRCNRCEKPICLRCAVLTDVGYRCKECIRGVQASYFNAIPTDNLVGFGVALLVTTIAAPIAGFVFGLVPFFLGVILAFAIGGAAGGALAQIIRTAVGRRRGRYLRHFTLAGIVLGVFIGSVVGLFIFRINPLNLSTLAFTILSAATAYRILR